MPRPRDPNRDKAFDIYKKSNGKIDLVEIASQLNISDGTVRGWKSKDDWDGQMNGTLRKNTERSKRNKNKQKGIVADAVEQVLENPDLTDKQRLFCCLYARCFNATKAYQKAYGVDYNTAASIGYRLLENDGVKKEIQKLKRNRLNREMLSEEDVFQKYIDIAFADITDFVEFGTKEVHVMTMYGPAQTKDPKTGKKVPLMQTVNTVQFRESSQVDGTLISEVKQGRDGASIKLADRMKALQWLSAHMDLATDEQKTKIKLMEMQITAAASTGNEAVEDWIDAVTEEDSEDITDGK